VEGGVGWVGGGWWVVGGGEWERGRVVGNCAVSGALSRLRLRGGAVRWGL